MSDPVSIGLAVAGLLPVVVEVFTGFKKTCSALRLTSNCTKALKSTALDVQIQQTRFLLSLERILYAAHDDDGDIKRMMDDLDHPLWTDSLFDLQVRICLAKHFDLFVELMEEIKAAFQAVNDLLQRFDLLRQERREASEPKAEIYAGC